MKQPLLFDPGPFEEDSYSILAMHARRCRLAARRPTDQHWLAAESSVGCVLPDSYKKVCSLFGYGVFGEHLRCLMPGNPAEYYDFTVENISRASSWARAKRRDLAFYPEGRDWLVVGSVASYQFLLAFRMREVAGKVACPDLVYLIEDETKFEATGMSFSEFLLQLGFGKGSAPAMTRFIRDIVFKKRMFFTPNC